MATPGQPYRCGVLTLSDKGSRGEREDTSGPQIQEMLQAEGYEIAAYQIIPDQQDLDRTDPDQLGWMNSDSI